MRRCPSRATDAQGQAIFQVNDDGTAISYKLDRREHRKRDASAYSSCAFRNERRRRCVALSRRATLGCSSRDAHRGFSVQGEITAASLVEWLCGQPLSALLDAMRNGGAYVNVHTSQFPPGEIRGQVD